MIPLTYRELQLLKQYRAADERGKHAIDELARHEAEYVCRPAQIPHQDNVVQLARH